MSLPVRTPDRARLIDAWDCGLAQHPIDRALTVAAAFTGVTRSRLAELTIGERDELLMEIRRLLSGDGIAAVASCEACAERNEFELDASALPRAAQTGEPATISVRVGDRTVRARLPTSRDLALVVEREDAAAATRELMEHCLLDPVELDDQLADALEEGMADAEGLAALEIAFTCSACGAANRAPFDIASFVWSELDARMRRMLLDIDALAYAYGWGESAILALSDRRRALYVELARR